MPVSSNELSMKNFHEYANVLLFSPSSQCFEFVQRCHFRYHCSQYRTYAEQTPLGFTSMEINGHVVDLWCNSKQKIHAEIAEDAGNKSSSPQYLGHSHPFVSVFHRWSVLKSIIRNWSLLNQARCPHLDGRSSFPQSPENVWLELSLPNPSMIFYTWNRKRRPPHILFSTK